ncbi:MAG: hypothetical protein MJ202_07130 [Lentisphaeria bacterium]|nr:hypothetical protein [Lentisphaeria bacterium]
MKITEALIDKLIGLRDGGRVPASALSGAWVQELLSDGVLVSSSHGSRSTLTVSDRKVFLQYLAGMDERLGNLEKAKCYCANDGEASSLALRAEQAADTGNSKLKLSRSFPGFLVNSYEVIPARLGGHELLISPQEGTGVFVFNWNQFEIPTDVTVVGIENPENFRFVRLQKKLFEERLPGKKLLFVSRYPQSTDLRKWLMDIPNEYVHFGDFDLAGIKIFLTEFQKYLGDRAKFLIPDDIEERLKIGSAERYLDNSYENRHLNSGIPEVQRLIELIRKYKRCYDQEGYIAKITM